MRTRDPARLSLSTSPPPSAPGEPIKQILVYHTRAAGPRCDREDGAMTVDFRAVTEAEARIAQAFVEMLTSPEFQAAYYRLIEPSRKVAGAFEQLGRDLARRAADG